MAAAHAGANRLAYFLLLGGLSAQAAMVTANLLAGFAPAWPLALVWAAPPAAAALGLAMLFHRSLSATEQDSGGRK
ncbi:MAG: hypothetical protein KIS81_04180 [Maricaulaceae bacterium]|nr:hypothetical protein [Maricaulaceae bacterium]